VIDLLDVATTLDSDLVEAEPEAAAAMSEKPVGTEQEDDEVIDLLDMAATPKADAAETERQDPTPVPEETVDTLEADEPIIDLLDAVEPPPAEAGASVEADDEFTDLESRAQAILSDTADALAFETPEEAAETAGPDSDFMVFEDGEAIIVEDETPAIVGNDAKASPDIPESPSAGLVVPVSPSDPVSLTEAQIEAALERTIEKIYGEKIERLIIRTIEKTVTREIARIKNAILENDDDMVG
jgi:hypothetical protein